MRLEIMSLGLLDRSLSALPELGQAVAAPFPEASLGAAVNF